MTAFDRLTRALFLWTLGLGLLVVVGGLLTPGHAEAVGALPLIVPGAGYVGVTVSAAAVRGWRKRNK